ncbi:hemagglutinin-hemolysin-like protein [Marine Group I thaumarchaeote SCGC RSA3]|uniref:Hemagglutinin-hemolysin-like protein n=1 Tax=Marine Group I thaumarchaeote SCGC RSA3 TaxID=1503183 RepID=A0A087S4Z6_9ARCH|nr:hemagglutinin-hemolysin-like protein [Marine Group I thaumarchaeote SCGC RSA3]
MKKIFVLFLIIALSTSTISYNSSNFVSAEQIGEIEIHETQLNEPQIQSFKNIKIELHDGFSFSEDNLPTNFSEQPAIVSYEIKLFDSLKIAVDDKNFEELIYLQFPFNNFALLDRISEKDKPKSKRNSVTLDGLLKSDIDNSEETVFEKIGIDVELSNYQSIEEFFSENDFTKIIFFEQLVSESNDLKSNQLIILAFVPLVGYVFLKTEVQRFPIVKSKQIFTSFFVVLLVFSLFSIPYSISENYWSVAYAEEISNSTDNSVKVTIEPLQPVDEEPDLEQILAEITAEMEAQKLAESTNSTSTEPVMVSNSTNLVKPVMVSNSTNLVNATTTEPVILSNSTSTNSTSTEPEIVIPDATVSFDFNKSEPITNSTSPEPVTVSNTTSTELDSGTLQLDGQDDFIQIENVTVTDDVDGLTVTAWVKPDYASGSGEFTILSKEKSFSLTITNNFLSENTAKFSVFDGIKWTTVESTSIISENWSFLSSTFDGDAIAMFVNGTREATQQVAGIPTLTPNGKLDTTTVENLTSEEDIVIGATITTKDEQPKASNQFSGEIDDVLLYDYVLEDEQILAMYEQSKETYDALVAIPELSIEEIIAQMEAEQLANSENATSEVIEEQVKEPIIIEETPLDVTPILTPTEESFEISQDAELELEFFSEEDVLLNELEELENSLLLLEELEAELLLIEDSLTEDTTTAQTPILGFVFSFFAIPEVDAAPPNDKEQSKLDIDEAKKQIKALKEKIQAIKSGQVNEKDLKEAKSQLKSIISQLKSTANNLDKSNGVAAQKIKDSSANIEKIADAAPEDVVQENIWISQDEQITTEIYDAKGNLVEVEHQYEKIRDGKFKLKLDFDSENKPGLYKVKTTILVDGEAHTVEEEFAWGLVSLNTYKSTYSPGDLAEFVIVVLDSEGHPISGADVSMSITNPLREITFLSTSNGITEGAEIGLYYAQYQAGVEGVYTVDINAQADGIDTNFSTTFDVAEFVEFDIIRTAQSKIDPTTNPNSFDVVIDIESFTGVDTITITETIPAVLEVETDATVTTNGDRKVLTWIKSLVDEKTSATYTYSVPYVFPSLYDLGPIDIRYGDQTFTEARPWYVANDPAVTNQDYVLVADPTQIQTGNWANTAGGTTDMGESINEDHENADGVTLTSASASDADTNADSAVFNLNSIGAGEQVDSVIIAIRASEDTTRNITPFVEWQYANGTVIATFSPAEFGATASTQFSSVLTPLHGPVPTSEVDTSVFTLNVTDTGGGNGNRVVDFVNLLVNATSTGVSRSASPTDRLGLVDTVTVTASKNISLTERLGLRDTVATEAAKQISLTERLGIRDTVATEAAKQISLTERLGLRDTVDTEAAKQISLTERLGIRDTVATTAAKTISLTERLGLRDSINATKSITMSSSEVKSDTTIDVTFSTNLDSSSVATSDFTISGFSVTGVSVNNNVVTLTISPALSASATPTIQLTGSVSDSSGNTSTDNQSTVSSADTTVVAPKITLVKVNNTPYLVNGTSESNSSIRVFANGTSVGTGTADNSGNWGITITTLSDAIYVIKANQTDTSNNTSSNSTSVTVTIDSTDPTTVIQTTTDTKTITVSQDDTEVILSASSSNIDKIVIEEDADETLFIDYSDDVSSDAVTITNGYDIEFSATHASDGSTTSSDAGGKIKLADGTKFTGPSNWDGKLQLPVKTTVSLSEEFSDTAVFQIGSADARIELDKPARIEFSDDGNENFVAFFVDENNTFTEISAICTSDSASGLGDNNECKIEVDGDLVIWTDHFTKFGVSKKSSSVSASTTSTPSGGGGNTGVGPSGKGAGVGGFGGILGTPLTINEVSYDKCDENIARILVSSDAENPPIVTIHTTKTGTVIAVLSDEQPYEELNKITRVDKYVYEIPITSNETFLMVTVTEEKGTVQNTVNAAINTPSCDGVVVVSDVPEDEIGEIQFGVPRIFDVKFQIENGTQHIADVDSEFFYVSEQDLYISAIIDSKIPLKRVELRTLTLGQSDDEYIAIKMNVEPLIYTESAYQVTASIPSYLMQDPAVGYWIHVIDEELSEVESKHYTMGVKPITEPYVSLELDVPSIQASNSIVRPSLYVENEQAPAYGIVSLLVDGEVVSKQAQFFDNGQTKVSFDWKTPFHDGLSSYDIQGKVDLYGTTKMTDSAVLYNYPKTVSMSAYDMKPLQPIEIDGNVLSEPVLIYASDSQDEFKFNVIAPNGQCIIGSSDECSVQDNTRGNRGGLQSVEYDGQILRVKYSGHDSTLERFSITSIDPLVGDWIVTLETEEGFIPQAQAIKDLTVKVKQKIISEMITVYSD